MFKRSILVLITLLGMAAARAEGGATLRLFADCTEGGRVWFSYEASEDGHDSTIGYLDDGPGIYFDEVRAGMHQRVAEAVLDENEAAILLFVSTWFGEQYMYAEAWVTRETAVATCAAQEAGGDLFTITKAAAGGTLFRWQIRDANGNWNDIAGVRTAAEWDSQGQAFTRLVLGADNGNHNADDYRVLAFD